MKEKTKKCRVCGIEKTLNNYYKQTCGKYFNRCKSCELENKKKAYSTEKRRIAFNKRKKKCIGCDNKMSPNSKRCWDCLQKLRLCGAIKTGKQFLPGPNHPNWIGGISSDVQKIRNSNQASFWKRCCLIRDNFTCQKTGKRGGRLQVHHINNFSEFPELRFVIDNGITLSREEHRNFHKKFGIKNNTLEQLIDFLKS